VRTLKRLLVLSALGAALVLPATAQAASPISVQVIVGFSCVNGTGPANAKVVVTLRTPTGRFRDSFKTTSDQYGTWSDCFGSLFSPSAAINGGDRLRIDAGNKSRSLTIPDLTPRIDRVTNMISGEADANAPLSIQITHLKSFKKFQQFSYSPNADGAGNWSIDTTGDFNLRGLDNVTVLSTNGSDLFGALAYAPFVQVQHASNVLAGSVNPGTKLEFTLTDENAVEKGTATAGPFMFGVFEVTMFDDAGKAMYPDGGDWLSSDLAPDATLQLPVSELRGSAATDTVSGRCMPDSSYLLVAKNDSFYGTTNSAGEFGRYVGGRTNLRHGDHLSLSCMYQTGDLWSRNGSVD
jgi:hypothetical protein